MDFTVLTYSITNYLENTVSPSNLQICGTYAYQYWMRRLFHRVAYSIECKYPKSWDSATCDFVTYCLFKTGRVVAYKSLKYGFDMQPCTLSGMDLHYQPNTAIVSNPLLPDFTELEIHKDCELLRLTPDYCGCWDIIEYYAAKLALMNTSEDVAIQNTRFSKIIGGKTKGIIQALKKIVDKTNRGESAVFYDSRMADDMTSGAKDTPFQIWQINAKDDYTIDLFRRDTQALLNAFDNEIGISTVPYEKKERMVTSEAESKEEESIANITVWLECLNNSAAEVRKMFGLKEDELSFKMRKKIDEDTGGDENGNDTN